MKIFKKALCGAVVFGALGLGPAFADDWDKLRADTELQDGLVMVAIVDYLRDNCADLQVKRTRAFFFATSLRNRATSLGYTSRQIDDYLDDETEKARIRAIAMEELREHGARPSRPRSICRAADAMMQSGSAVGNYVRLGS